VAILEASRYREWRAGETLPPGSQRILQSLGCWERFLSERFLQSFGSRAAWGGEQPYDNEFLFSAHGNGWHLDRVRFDRMLCECAHEAGAEVLQDARLASAQWAEDRIWRISFHRGGQHEALEASFVVDATGRSAAFAVHQGARRLIGDHLTGASVVFRFAPNHTPADTYTLVEAQEDGWWYSSMLPDSRAVAIWMSDADLVRSQGLRAVERWMEHLRRSRLTAERLAFAEPETPPGIWAAQSQRLSRATGPGWVAAGDAASTFDPLSSQGILKALRSGKLASFVAIDWLQGMAGAQARYERTLAAEYEQYHATKIWFYGLEQRWRASPFWRRRQRSDG
jgi:flavin-dependent dehydrogenase